MGQYFQFINVDHRESTHTIGKIGEGRMDIPYDEGLCSIIEAQYKPTYEGFLQKDDTHIKYFSPRRTSRKGDLGAFKKLPAELIAMISYHMEIIPSIAFGVTNSQLLALAYPSISNQMMDFWDNTMLWAHCRIVYLGDWARDLPEGFISEKEKLKLLEDFPKPPRADQGFPLYSIANEFYREGLGHRHLPVGGDLRDVLSRAEYQQYRCLYNLPVSPKYWGYLINTTKQEYIKASVKGVDLQTMIMPLIIWSDEETKDFGVDNQGPWAGDRVAIVSTEDFAARVAEAGPGVWVNIVDKGLKLQNQWIESLGRRDPGMIIPWVDYF